MGYPDHDGAEDDRGDQHLDELDEAVRQRLEVGAECGPEPTDSDTADDRNKELNEQRRIPSLTRSHGDICHWHHVRDSMCQNHKRRVTGALPAKYIGQSWKSKRDRSQW